MVGIDHHEPTNDVVVSVNYPTGGPHTFELIASDGSHSQFSGVSGLTDEVKIATIRTSDCQGGFTIGEMFTGNGVSGQIARISADGNTVTNPWVTLPGEAGLLRGALFQDRFCSFSGDLIVVTSTGGVWRVTSAGLPTNIVTSPDLTGMHLEGVTTVPNDAATYGPWAGKILTGAEELGCVYAIDADGAATCHSLGITPEDLDIIPENENFYGVDFGNQTLWGVEAAQFDGIEGDLVIAQELPGILFHVKWDGATSAFVVEQVAQVSQWEHVAFSSAGINPISEITLDPLAAENLVGSSHTVTATVSVVGQPAEGELVDFEVVSGPNTDATGVCTVAPECTTDEFGQVSFTYTGAGGVGTDQIQACFASQICSRKVTKEWTSTTTTTLPTTTTTTAPSTPTTTTTTTTTTTSTTTTTTSSTTTSTTTTTTATTSTGTTSTTTTTTAPQTTTTTTTLPPVVGCSDFPCGRQGRKVEICHVPPGNDENPQTLCISPSEVSDHLGLHGDDSCGVCE